MGRGQHVMFVLPGVNNNRAGGERQRPAGRQIIRWMSRFGAESYQQGTTGKQTIFDVPFSLPVPHPHSMGS